MTQELESRARSLFDQAADLEGAARVSFLGEACAGAPELRARVESLLTAAERDGPFLSDPERTPGRHGIDEVSSETTGAILGRYKLIERVGEGGFGSVFLAEQLEPVRRRVAVKIVKLGMDTRAVVARFEQERQALAMMDHPNIARVFDAGVTPAGRPYFVMEYVAGEPIVAFCDARVLTVRERIALLLQVCDAVQHAHVKGIIHRDIKPGNVLVTSHEGKPVVKVIDFGIARAVDQGAAGAAKLTEVHQLLGTPEYMSPEQATASSSLDTRTDVYSLGVLLYELLVGVPPFDPKRLRTAAYAEVQRILREVDPPKPSTRIAEGKTTLTDLAARRGTSPGRLESSVRGELDWIVMRAIEKEPARRYGSAEALRADLERHLAGQAVDAAPPSAAYRLRKVVRRYRGPMIAAAFVFLALVAGTVGTGIGLVKATNARADAENNSRQAGINAARAERESENARRQAEVAMATVKLLTRDILAGVDTGAERGRADVTVREMLDRAAAKIDSGESLRSVAPMARATVTIAVKCAIARSYRVLGLYDKAASHAAAAIELARQANSPQPALLADALVELGEIHRSRQDREAAFTLLTEALALREEDPGESPAKRAEARSALAGVELIRGNYKKAEALTRQAMDETRVAYGEESAEMATILSNLAQIRSMRDAVDDSVELLGRASEIHKRLLGEDSLPYVRDLFNLASILANEGKYEAAVPYFRTVLVKSRGLYPEGHPFVANCQRSLGYTLYDLGQAAEAVGFLRAALDADRKATGPSKAFVTISLSGLGRALLAVDEFAEAEATLAELERTLTEVSRKNSMQWHIYDARGLRAEAIVGDLDASSRRSPTSTRPASPSSRFIEAEKLLVDSFEHLVDAEAGRQAAGEREETRRCQAASRLVRLYEVWRASDGVGDIDVKRLDIELERWRNELARLRALDVKLESSPASTGK